MARPPMPRLPARLAAFSLALLFAALMLAAGAPAAQAQESNTRFGLGVGATASTVDGLGLGVRARVSAPLSRDLSLAADVGATGFILGGTEDAVTVLDPQVSAIINLPVRGDQLSYVMAGVGAHVPLANTERSESGPTLHAGYGRVYALQDNSIYWEVNPALLVGDDSVDLLVPVRLGIIFR